MAEEYGEQVFFLGVSNNDTIEAGEEYQSRFEVPYALAHAPEVWALYDDPPRPSTFIIGPDGDVVEKVFGPIVYEDLKASIDSALGSG